MLLICEECGWSGEGYEDDVECPKCGSGAIYSEKEYDDDVADLTELIKGGVGDWDE